MNEAEIRAEVEKRKQRAQDLGLPQGLFRLYENHLKYLDKDFDHESSSMPKSLTKVVRNRLHDGMNSTESTELFFGEWCIVFVFRERNTTMPDGEISTWGNLLISIDSKVVFDLACHRKDDRYGECEWYAGDVEGFIEGPWVAEIGKFAQQVSSIYDQRKSEIDQRSKLAELERLKNNFGL
jgi:hypothetical protein